MDKVISAAIELGKILQADERFIRYQLVQQANDADEELQQMMVEFEQKRHDLNIEVQKETKDTERIKTLDKEVRDSYAAIFDNKNVIAFSEAQMELRQLLDYVNQIIAGSSEGVDPETIEYTQACASGGCSSCSGC